MSSVLLGSHHLFLHFSSMFDSCIMHGIWLSSSSSSVPMLSFLCISLLNYKAFSALIGVIAETYTTCTTIYERPRMDGWQKMYNYWCPQFLFGINSYTFVPPPYPWCLRYLFVAFASLKSQRQHLVLTDFRQLAAAVPHSLLLNRLNRDPMFQHL